MGIKGRCQAVTTHRLPFPALLTSCSSRTATFLYQQQNCHFFLPSFLPLHASSTMASMQTKPLLKYLDLRPLGPVGGRGNAVRLYMLANKMSFDEELVSIADWRADEKAKCIKSLNPAGSLPVLVIGDKSYAEHVSICRYLARKNGQYGKDPEVDFVADAAGDAYTDWVNTWANLIRKPDTDEAVKTYRDTRSKFYTTLEWYYGKKSSPSSPYLTGGTVPGFIDVTVFNMIRDDALMHTAVDLSPYPDMKMMFEAVGSNPEVKAWVQKWEAESCAMAA